MATALLEPDPSMIVYGRELGPNDPPPSPLPAPEYEQALRNEMDFCIAMIERGLVPESPLIRIPADMTNASRTEKARLVWKVLADNCMQVFPFSQGTRTFLETQSFPEHRLSISMLDIIGVYLRILNKLEMIPEVKSSGVDPISLQAHEKLNRAMKMVLKIGVKRSLPLYMIAILEDNDFATENLQDEEENASNGYTKFIRMNFYLERLFDLYSNPGFANEIMARNLNVFLVAAIHTSFAPSKVLDRQHSENLRSSEELIVKVRAMIQEKFEGIFPVLPKTLLLRHLFLLQQNKVPNWFKRHCRLIGGRILTGPNGVKNLMAALQEVFDDSKTEDVIKVVCNLMKAQVLAFKPLERPNVLSSFCEQLLELIVQERPKVQIGYDIQEVAVRAGLMLLDFEPTIAKPLIWHKVFERIISLNLNTPNSQIHLKHIQHVLELLALLQKSHKYAIHLKDSVFDAFRPVWSTIFKIFVCLSRYLATPVKMLSTELEVARYWDTLRHSIGAYLSIVHCRGLPNLIDICIEFIIFYDNEHKMVPVRYMIYHSGNSDEKDIVLKRDSCLDVAASWYTIVTEDTTHFLDSVLRQEFVSNDILSSLFTQLLGFEFKGLEEIAVAGQENEEIEEEKTFEASWNTWVEEDKISSSPFRNPTRPNITDMNTKYSMNILKEAELLRFITLRLLSGYGTEDSDLYGAMRGQLDQQSLIICLLILKRSVREMEYSERLNMPFISNITMDSCLHTLNAMAECVRRPGEIFTGDLDIVCNWGDLDAFVPFLQKIVDSQTPGVQGTASQSLAEDTLIIIKTRGLGLNGKGSFPERSSYQRTMENLVHPAAFMKGAALIQLKKLIIQKNVEVLKAMDGVLEIVQREMRSCDSYVYLNAIAALAELAACNPFKVIPILVREYTEGFESEEPDTSTRDENRLKVAQTIYYVIRKLGDLAPKYSYFFLNGFLALLRDTDPSVRASGLSNLGQLAQVLRFTLPQVLNQMFDAACCILNTDMDDTVRRGALTLILDSLKAIRAMPRSAATGIDEFGIHLRDVRRKVMSMRERECDHLCMHYLDAILSELYSIGQELLTPSGNMEFKLRVLSQH